MLRVMGVCIVVACMGCATLGYRYFPNTKRYTYDRDVSVEVRSEPDGATIVDETGKVVGTAPMTLHTRHRVERTRKSRSKLGLTLGCIVDLGGGIAGLAGWAGGVLDERMTPQGFIVYDVDVFSSTRQRVLLLGASLLLVDCMIHAISPIAYSIKERGHKDALQVMERPYSKDVVTERLIPRPVSIEARWPDWSPTRLAVTIPDHTLVTLRRNHAGTFDDALVRRARTGAALGPEGLYRVGHAYHRMVRDTKDPVHAREAASYFERYLASGDVLPERRTEVERLLGELRPLTKVAR